MNMTDDKQMKEALFKISTIAYEQLPKCNWPCFIMFNKIYQVATYGYAHFDTLKQLIKDNNGQSNAELTW